MKQLNNFYQPTKIFNKLFLVIVFSLSLFFISGTVLAAENQGLQSSETPPKDIGDAWGGDQISSPVDCFQYYHFQSVQVSVDTDKNTYNPGETIKFKGELINENDYPVFDGYVFVRLSRENENYAEEGNYIIDEFIPIKKIVLDGNETKPVNFQWKIPQNLAQGDYRADFFFSVGKKFNLGGLPFSNEVIIGFSSFSINSSKKAYISFDRSATKVNGEEYQHIGNWPVVDPGKEIVITQPILNTFNEDKEVKVTYDLYYWDSLNEKDKIKTTAETKTIPAKAAVDLKYVIPKMEESVYYLKIAAKSGEQASIVNIRIVSPQEKPRINYPALTKFPLKKGDKFTLFSCFHDTSNLVTKGHIIVLLTDKAGNKVGKMDYHGDISSAMMADKTDLTAPKDYTYLKLTAQMYDKNNKLVDSYENIYDCKALNKCPVKAKTEKPLQAKPTKKSNLLSIIIVILSLATILVMMAVIRKKRKQQS